MPDTVDPAAAPPRTLAQIIEGTGAALCVACTASRGNRSRTFISLRAGRHRGGVTGAPGKLEQAQGQWRVRLDGCLGEWVCRSASAAAQRPHAGVTFASDRDSSRHSGALAVPASCLLPGGPAQ